MVSSISSNDVGFAPQSRVAQMLIANIIPAAVASIIVLARLYSRAVIMKNWGYDDSWILVSWILGSIALTAVNGILTARGTNVQTPEIVVLTMRLGFTSRELYQVCIGTTKLGICCFYLRIFQDHVGKIIIRSTMGFIAVFTLGLSMGIFFQCKPISGAWNDVAAVCGNQDPGIIATLIVNILADIILLSFVVPRILTLKITRQQKVSLLMIVSLGLLVIAAAVMRAVFTLQVLNSGQSQPWDSYQIAIWSSVEINSGLICASAPAMKPVLRKIAPMFLGPPPTVTTSSGDTSASKKRYTYDFSPMSFISRHYGDKAKGQSQSDLEAGKFKVESQMDSNAITLKVDSTFDLEAVHNQTSSVS